MVELNEDQSIIVNLALDGHNIFVTGQAGVGKSEVVRHIIRNSQAVNQKVVVVCSTGIACYVHEPGVASTVHSWYGLQTADLPWRQVLDRAAGNSLVVERVKSADVVIWDEASMCSRRTLELVNAFHHRLANNDLSRQHPFAGKQFILVGEFLQLRPVPDVFDDVGFIHQSSNPFFLIVLN